MYIYIYIYIYLYNINLLNMGFFSFCTILWGSHRVFSKKYRLSTSSLASLKICGFYIRILEFLKRISFLGPVKLKFLKPLDGVFFPKNME